MTLVQLEDRAVLTVSGADARPFLQGLLTNDIALLTPASPLYAGLLSPQGKALFDMMLFADGDDVAIDVAADRAEALGRRLSMYRLRKAVSITASQLLVFAGWDDDAVGQTADPRFGPLGARWLAPATGAPDLGSARYRAHRLAIGVPDSADIGQDELLWLETGADLLHGVSFDKGCYVGQENTARMHHRDKVRRRLVPIGFAGDGGDGSVRDSADRAVGSLRSHSDGLGFAHLRLEALAGPLRLGDSVLTIAQPAWLKPALLAA